MLAMTSCGAKATPARDAVVQNRETRVPTSMQLESGLNPALADLVGLTVGDATERAVARGFVVRIVDPTNPIMSTERMLKRVDLRVVDGRVVEVWEG